MFADLIEEFGVFGNGFKYFINELFIIVPKLLTSFNLTDMIFFLKQLKQPVVSFLLDFHASDVFKVWVDPNPEDWTFDVFDFE